MSDIENLADYRIEQAGETLSDAELMLKNGVSARSVVNRAYYAMFYMTLALFLKTGIPINTSRHSGIIGIFDREFIIKGCIDKSYSGMLHALFDDRQEFDYKEFSIVTSEQAESAVKNARSFISHVKKYIADNRLPE